MNTILFTGGCRSGKSTLAKTWAEERASVRAYVATARASLFMGEVVEMVDRVA